LFFEEFTSELGCDSIVETSLLVLDATDPECNMTSTFDQSAHGSNINLKAYPNPVKNILHIEFEGKTNLTNAFNLKIYSVDQKIVFQKDLPINSFKVDVSNFASGVYFLILENEQRSSIAKFIKIK